MSQNNDEEIESFEPDDAVDNRPGLDEDLDVEGDEDPAGGTDDAETTTTTTTTTTMTTMMMTTSPRTRWPTRSTS